MISHDIERRRIQRDWVGHGLQVIAILVVLGVPLLIWGSGVNTTIATLNAKQEEQSKALTTQVSSQAIIANQVIEVGKQLTRIDTLMDIIRENSNLKKVK